MADDPPITDEQRLTEETQATLVNALTSTQEAIGSVRDASSGVEPTPALARADAFLVEASTALQEAVAETRQPISPEQKRITELETELESLKTEPKHPGPVAPAIPSRKDVRPVSEGRPRGMRRFTEGHTPLPEGEDDFEPSVPAPVGGYAPGQGTGRLRQAAVTGQGPSAGDALARQQEARDRADLDAIRAAQGLPPGGPGAS